MSKSDVKYDIDDSSERSPGNRLTLLDLIYARMHIWALHRIKVEGDESDIREFIAERVSPGFLILEDLPTSRLEELHRLLDCFAGAYARAYDLEALIQCQHRALRRKRRMSFIDWRLSSTAPLVAGPTLSMLSAYVITLRHATEGCCF